MSELSNRPILHLLEGRKGELRAMRFWSKVDMRSPEECWDWRASVNLKGYGRFKIASYVVATAHRVALVLSTKSEPAGLHALHSCDRPQCCNPHHLRWGTVQDNSNDMKARGRSYNGDQRGFRNGSCKLTAEQFAEIIQGLRSGKNNMEIAEGLPIGHALVSRIRRGHSWAEEAAALGWPPTPHHNDEEASHG